MQDFQQGLDRAARQIGQTDPFDDPTRYGRRYEKR